MQASDDITKPSSNTAKSSVSHQDLLAKMHQFRGATASVVSLLHDNRLSVLPEYVHQASSQKSSGFAGNEFLVAMELIGLWMPIPKGESTNFIPRYELSADGKITANSKYGIVAAQNFQKHPPEDMRRFFLKNNLQNLGALSFLNLFLGGSFTHSRLGIVVSETTSIPYFTIKASQFWGYCDDLIKKVYSKDIFKYILTDKPQFKSWWDSVVGEINPTNIAILRYIFITEIFPLMIRIHLTPDLLIKSIVYKILGQSSIADYLINFITKAKKSVVGEHIEHLTPEDKGLWSLFLENQALEIYVQYEIDIESYLAVNELVLYSDPLEWQLPMYKSAVYCNISNINDTSLGLLTTSDDVLARVHLLGKLNELMEENWSVVSRFGDYPYWQLANNNCINLHELMTKESRIIELEDDSIEFQFGLLLGAIKYKHNDLARFLIHQFHSLSVKIIERTEFLTLDARLCLGQSLIFYCNKVNNIEVFNLLAANGAVLEPAIVTEKPDKPKIQRSRCRRGSFFDDGPNLELGPALFSREDERPQTAIGRPRSRKVYDFNEIAEDVAKALASINESERAMAAANNV